LRPAKSCPSHSVYGSHAARSDSKSVELAIPQSLLTSVGGPTPSGNRFRCPPQQRKRNRFPPPFFSASTPEYIIPDAAAAPPPATTIALDGTFTDWQAAPPRGRHRRGDRSSLFNPATDPSDWAALTAAAAEIPLTAILNPNSGPGTSQDLGYVSAINASPLSHVHWIGRLVPFEQYEVGERWRSLMVGGSSSGDRDLGSSRHARRAFLSLDLESDELSRLRPESVAWRGGGASAGCREWVAKEGLKLAPS
jgi:hypothetical protein